MTGAGKQRGLLKKISIAGASLLATLVVFEAVLRAQGVTPMQDLRDRILPLNHFAIRSSANPEQQYELIPGAQGPGVGCTISINSDGLRDREHTLEKKPGVQRILVLGDSVTFGSQVEAEQTFPSVLERHCRERDLAAEVFNMGVVGYDTLQSVAFLEQTGLAFDPDLVVLAHCMNDVAALTVELDVVESLRAPENALTGLRVVQWLRARRLQQVWSTAPSAPRSFEERNAGTIIDLTDDQGLQAQMASIAGAIANADRRPHFILPWYTEVARVGRLRYSLQRLADLSEEHGFQVLVVVLPFLKEPPFAEQWRVAYDIVESQAQEVGLETLQLAPGIRAAGPRSLRAAERDYVHLNPKGHERVAQLLLEGLIERGLIGP